MEITAPVVGEVSAQAWNDIENIGKIIPEGKPPNLEANRDRSFGGCVKFGFPRAYRNVWVCMKSNNRINSD